MGYSVRLTESENIVATIQTVNATGSYYSDAIPMNSNYGRRFEADINVGTITGGGTVDFAFQWSTTSGGTYANFSGTGTSITQDTVGSLTHRVEVATEFLNVLNPTALFMKGYLKTLVAATPCGVVIRSSDVDYAPITNSASHIGQVVNSQA